MEATNKVLSIIAFYLSEYDMDAVNALGFKNKTDAISTISSEIGKGNSYLSRRRDEFDALPDSASTRVGYNKRPPAKGVVEMAAYLHQFSFDELTEIVKTLIEKPEELVSLAPGDNSVVNAERLDEEEIERIANLSDTSAKLVYRAQTGSQRVYNRSIILQLKKLYRGCCQICGSNPFPVYGADICEAHHIEYFAESQNNDASNIIILCPNHHRLIHKLKPSFDKDRLAYSLNGKEFLPVKMDYHLKRT